MKRGRGRKVGNWEEMDGGARRSDEDNKGGGVEIDTHVNKGTENQVEERTENKIEKKREKRKGKRRLKGKGIKN